MKTLRCLKRSALISVLCLSVGMSNLALAIQIREVDILNAMIAALEKKEPKTELDENLLTLARVMTENSAYLDENTLKEFNSLAYMARAAEDRESILKEPLSKHIAKLVAEERIFRNDYIKSSEKQYEKIATLLGISQ